MPALRKSDLSLTQPQMEGKLEMKMRLNKHSWLAGLLVALLLLLPTLLSAQSIVTGAISGNITDPSGAVIVGATVNLKNIATGETLATTSSSDGVYQFTLLKPGSYTLTVTQQGFKQVSQAVEILLGQTSTANLKLELGSGAVTVEVTAQGAMLQTEDANITTTVSTRDVENVPNPGGDLTYVAQISPGVTMNTANGGLGNFSAFGLPGTANLFTINGNDYNDPYLNLNNSGSSNLLLGSNETQEVAVVSNGYTGQYGRQAGAQIDYTTKSGTNAFHGDALYYWTGRALSANDYFNNLDGVSRPFENNNQWAANFGGPIVKDKLFFFANTEGIRYIFGTNSQVSLPAPDFQQFVLSQIPATATTFYQSMFGLYNATPGISRAALTPNSCASVGSFADPVTGNPASTECLESFGTSGSSGNREWLLTVRGDYSISDKDKLFARYKVDRGVQPTYTDPINPAFSNESIQPQNDWQINETHIFSPNLVNNIILSHFNYSAIFESPDITKALSIFPVNMLSTDSALTALGTGSGNPGGAAQGFLYPGGRKLNQWQVADDLSRTLGSHNFKMGVNFRHDGVSDFTASTLTQYPIIAVPLEGFATDTINIAGIGGNIAEHFARSSPQDNSFYSVGLYFQDEYRVNSKLKLTLTMRADRNSGGVCASNCNTLTPVPFDQLPHGAAIPYNQSFITGLHNILPNVEKVSFQPRIGFAWSPLGQNTVIRGGVGLFTDLYPATLLSLYTTNFPQVTSFTVQNGTIATNEANSGFNIIPQCNTAFQTAYNSGGGLSGPNGFNTLAPAGCQNQVPSVYATNGKVLNPKYLEWNVEVQHSFGNRTVVSANYVGNHGYDGILYNPYGNAFGFNELPAIAPDPRVAGVISLTNDGYSNYNGLTLSARQNLWRGFSGQLNYTYSHDLDLVSNGGVPGIPYNFNNSIPFIIDPFNIRANYGPSDYDIRHVISADYVWDIPVKSENRLINAAIGGWTVSGTVFRHSGAPFSVLDGNTANSIAGNNLLLSGAPTAFLLAQPSGPVNLTCNGNSSTVFNPNLATPGCLMESDFVSPSTNFVGSIGRNAFRGPSYFNTDLGLKKLFKLNERLGFTVGANAYNILNHVNFNPPFPNLANPTVFGHIFNAATPPTTPYGASGGAAAVDARIVQVFGKLTF
jgi:hypothetical protein